MLTRDFGFGMNALTVAGLLGTGFGFTCLSGYMRAAGGIEGAIFEWEPRCWPGPAAPAQTLSSVRVRAGYVEVP